MSEEIIAGVICAFLGTFCYGIIFNVPRRYELPCGLTGAAGWLTCVLVTRGTIFSAAVAAFFGAMVVVVIGRALTVIMKCPLTLFLAPGILPLVPGARIYYTAYYLVTGQLSEAVGQGLEALKCVFAIVLGITVIVALPRELFRPGYWRQSLHLLIPFRKS